MPEMNDRAVSSAQAPPRLLQELRETLQRLRLGGPFYVLLWLLAGAAANLWLRFPVAFIAISLGFIGLTVRHTQAHLTRAVLEGVAFGLRDSFELMLGAGLGGWTTSGCCCW